MEIHLDRIKQEEQYKLVMGLVVPRPIGFVSTADKAGNFNVAPYSFFNLMSGVPGVVVLGVNHRPGGPKDSYANIEETGEFVLNVVSRSIAQAMNLSSLECPADIDEFEITGLTPVPSVKVKAPRVKEAPAHMECRLQQFVSITETRKIIIGEIIHVQVDDAIVGPTYRIDPAKLDAVGRMGGNFYVHTNEVFTMERPNTEAVLAEYRKRKG